MYLKIKIREKGTVGAENSKQLECIEMMDRLIC